MPLAVDFQDGDSSAWSNVITFMPASAALVTILVGDLLRAFCQHHGLNYRGQRVRLLADAVRHLHAVGARLPRPAVPAEMTAGSPARWNDPARPRSRIPIRTIAATIAMVLLTAAVLLLLGWEVRRVLTWIVVAALAIILGPLVDITERRLRLRQALATLLVF